MSAKSASKTATGTLVSGPARVLGGVVRATGTAGTAIFKDGGAGGTEKFRINTPAAVGAIPFQVGGGGIPFLTDVHVTLTNADAADIFYL